jgi:hypothetical protein
VSFELEPFGSDLEGLGLRALLQEDVPVTEMLALGFEGFPLSPECCRRLFQRLMRLEQHLGEGRRIAL